jgi:hypothetical protein
MTALRLCRLENMEDRDRASLINAAVPLLSILFANSREKGRFIEATL